MKRGEVLSATARAAKSRQATKNAIARELLYAGILARLWPSFIMTPDPEKLQSAREKRYLREYPYILAIESPAGWLAWRLSPEEHEAFDWVPSREHHGEKATDRTGVLLALATDGGWAIDGKYPR